MINAIKSVYNRKISMLWVLIFPGIMTIMSKESPIEYLTSVLITFILFVVIEMIFSRHSEKNEQN